MQAVLSLPLSAILQFLQKCCAPLVTICPLLERFFVQNKRFSRPKKNRERQGRRRRSYRTELQSLSPSLLRPFLRRADLPHSPLANEREDYPVPLHTLFPRSTYPRISYLPKAVGPHTVSSSVLSLIARLASLLNISQCGGFTQILRLISGASVSVVWSRVPVKFFLGKVLREFAAELASSFGK